MSKRKLTPWIDGSIKPTIPGVYQRQYSKTAYCLWSGDYWYWNGFSPEAAIVAANDLGGSWAQELPWRGLASDPNRSRK